MSGRRVLFAALVGLVAYLTIVVNQIPVPDGFEEPNGYRLMYMFISVTGTIVS